MSPQSVGYPQATRIPVKTFDFLRCLSLGGTFWHPSRTTFFYCWGDDNFYWGGHVSRQEKVLMDRKRSSNAPLCSTLRLLKQNFPRKSCSNVVNKNTKKQQIFGLMDEVVIRLMLFLQQLKQNIEQKQIQRTSTKQNEKFHTNKNI